MRIPFIAGNWKMFKTKEEAVEFAKKFKKLYNNTGVRVAICAPFTSLDILVEIFKDTDIGVGAQNVYFEDEGAFTGEISANMLKEIGIDYCIVGHSERRQYFCETDETINKKMHKLIEKEIIPIMCVGEILEERDQGIELKVVEKQLEEGLKNLSGEQVSKIVIAYEPVWAIGTGRTATPEQADEMCRFIRKTVCKLYDENIGENVIIQYGGSVKGTNSTEIM